MMQLGKDTNILICQKSKIDDWMEHFMQNYPNIQVYNLTIKNQLEDFILHDVGWSGYHGASMTVGVINYDLVFRRSELLELEHFTMMLDESSMITNPTAKRTKFIHKMKPDNCILLSGATGLNLQIENAKGL